MHRKIYLFFRGVVEQCRFDVKAREHLRGLDDLEWASQIGLSRHELFVLYALQHRFDVWLLADPQASPSIPADTR